MPAVTVTAIARRGHRTTSFTDWEAITVHDDAPDWQPVFGHVEVLAVCDDGSEGTLFLHYSDETTFSREELAELVGLEFHEAAKRANTLRTQRDITYLRS